MSDKQQDEITDIRVFANYYVCSIHFLVDNKDAPIHTRWEYVLKHLPDARKRYIYEDFEDVLTKTYASNSHDVVAAGVELARLRYFFFKLLLQRGFSKSHKNAWEIVNSEKWVMKLSDRFETIKRTKFVNGKLTTPAQTSTVHTWLN